MRSGVRRLTFAAGCVTLLLTMAGCIAPSDADHPVAVPPDGDGSIGTAETPSEAPELIDAVTVSAEYAQTAEALSASLPPGSSFPDALDAAADDAAQFEAGFGEISAAFIWQCEWLVEYRDATDDGVRVESLKRLSSWVDLPQVVPYIDAESRHSWHDTVVTPAAEGQDDTLRQLADTCA